MSHCIEELGLDLPPVTLWRVSPTHWVAVCMCGRKSRPADRISAAVGEAYEHGRKAHRRLTPAETLELALQKRPAA